MKPVKFSETCPACGAGIFDISQTARFGEDITEEIIHYMCGAKVSYSLWKNVGYPSFKKVDNGCPKELEMVFKIGH